MFAIPDFEVESESTMENTHLNDDEKNESESNYSSRIYRSLPFILRRWWRRDPADANFYTGRGLVTGGAWRLNSDPGCDFAEVDYPES